MTLKARLDLTEYDESKEGSFDIVPPGQYVAEIDTQWSALKDTKAGGQMFNVAFRIIEGEYKGRLVFSNYNLSGKGVGFTVELLKKTGLWPLKGKNADLDIHALHGKVIGVRIAVTKSEEYGDQNVVKKLIALDDMPQTAATKAGKVF